MGESNISRRSFLTGAATAGALGIAGGMLAGCAAQADSAGAGNKTARTGGETAGAAEAAANLTGPIEPVGAPETWDREVDIVVVGSGGGGLNAAARAAEQGASVVLIEKTAAPGGNTAQAGGAIVPGNSRYIEASQGGLPEYPFDINKWLAWKQEGHHHALNTEMQLLIGEQMGPAHDWMGDCGVDWFCVFGDTLIPMDGSREVHAAKQSKVTQKMYEYGQSVGAEYLFNTPAAALVMEDGRVVGVKAEDEDGNDLFLHAAKGVILCAGGFAANKDMLAEYCPNALNSCGNCYVAQHDSGEVTRMGLGAGGFLTEEDSFAMFDGGIDYESHGGEWCTYLYNGSNQLVRQPWLTIDRTGARKRYITTTDQPSMTGGALTDQANVQVSSPGYRSFIIFDDNYEESMKNFHEGACRMPLEPDMDRIDEFVPEHFRDWRNGAHDAIESGAIASGDTLEDLAAALGLDADVVTEAVEKWNAVCAAGEDDAAYPYNPEWLIPIEKAPFHGAAVGGILFRTNTGLAINTKMQVLHEDGTVVPGLYAGWFTAAGASATGVPSSIKYAGEGISLSYTGGYLCANSVLAEEA